MKRSFKKKDIESSESDSQSVKDNHSTMSSAGVSQKLASSRPMVNRKPGSSSMNNVFLDIMDPVEETGDELLSDRENSGKMNNGQNNDNQKLQQKKSSGI